MIDHERVTQLRERLQEKRQYGVVHFDVQGREKFDKGNDKATIDAYVISFDFNALGEHWVAINKGYAVERIVDLLRNVQYFHDNGLMSESDVYDFVSKIFEPYSEAAHYYTNIDRLRNSGRYVTGATFNEGVVFIDNKHVGIFWVDDED